MQKIIFLYLLSIFLFTTSVDARTLSINLSSPSGSKTMNIAIATPFGNASPSMKKLLTTSLEQDIKYVPFLSLLKQYTIGFNPSSKVNFTALEQAKIGFLLTTAWSNTSAGLFVDVEGYDVLSNSLVVSSRYKVTNEALLPRIADLTMSKVLEYLIGNGSLFNSRIFFSQREGHLKQTLWSVFPNGTGLRKETDILGVSLSPDVSEDGRFIIFTHIDKRRHTLALLDRKTRKIKRVVYPQGTSVISPTFMPSGSIAVALSFKGAPSIYNVSPKGLTRVGKILGDRTINISPSFSKKKPNFMVYTSNKFGGPQIFMKNLKSGAVTRISREGTYNTDPTFSSDGKFIAYVRMLKQGRRIFVYNVETRKTKQITFGPGDDDTPEFAPDSYFIAFVSTRNRKPQLFLTTREGTGAVLIPTKGNYLSDPAWGLAN